MTPHDEPTTDGKPSGGDETVHLTPVRGPDTAIDPGPVTDHGTGARDGADGTTMDSRPEPVRLDPTALTRGGGEAGRYTLHGELARGGMGVILRGRDTDLGRELAVKVLLESHRDRPDVLRRFIEEAQIGGQLQHPGVVPVYDLGTLDDRRPFFAMKLVRGQTLATLLRGRETAAADLPRFLGVFEQIAQTVGYAHAKGVIHRDLKPANVMVGAFGEVQVMDWGLAKTLQSADAPPADGGEVVRTVRTQTGADLSHDGSVLGTPAYMAPEQARGEVRSLDERADVFGLGAILCEVLTGAPPFVGASTIEILRMAADADTADALGRLDASGLDADLIALAKDCLARAPADRLRDGGVVAERITAYLAGVQERLRTSERERAVAEARADEERRRRKLQAGLAASVLTLAVVAGSVVAVGLQQRAARAAVVAKVLAEATSLRDQAAAHADDTGRWQSAREAIRRVEVALGPGVDPAIAPRLAALRRDVEAGDQVARGDQDLMAGLIDIRSARADDFGGRGTDAAYASAFRRAGLDLDAMPPAEAGRKIRARPPSVAAAFAAALDDWANTRRFLTRDATAASRLAQAAKVADPDPWRGDLRTVLDRSDKAARLAALKGLAETARLDELGPISLDQLGAALFNAGDPKSSETILRVAQRRFPGDVWVNHDLAMVLERQSLRDDAVRFYTAARSIRPETAHELGHALDARGDTAEAVAVFEDLARLRPRDGRHLGCLGVILKATGRTEAAAAALDAAVAAHRETIRVRPDDARAYGLMGLALMTQGKRAEAEAAYRESIRLRPDLATSHDGLARVLEERGKYDEAISSYREAIRLDPTNPLMHQNLCVPLAVAGRLAEAEAAVRRAIELQSDDAKSYVNLGNILKMQNRYDEAAAAYREAIRLRPRYASAYDALGRALILKDDPEGAVAALRQAVKLSPPGSAEQEQRVQMILASQGRLALAARLPAALRGGDGPKSDQEALVFADLAYRRGLYAASSRFFAQALTMGPDLALDRRAEVRYKAACAASLAGTGRGKDDPSPDDAAKATLRDQARGWLVDELKALGRVASSVRQLDRPLVAKALARWQGDADLAGVREDKELDKLPDAERKAWREFWAEVGASMNRARPE